MLKKQQGFTLIEIFIALVIGLFLIGGTLSVFVGLKSTTTETSSMGELQENGRFAVSILTDDLLRQDFWGDLSGQLSFERLITSQAAPATGECFGLGGNNGSFPQDASAFRSIWATEVSSEDMLDCINNADYKSTLAFNSDIIQIKRVLGVPIAPVNLNKSRYYLQSNITSANLFPGDVDPVPTLNASRIWEYQHHIYYIREDDIGSTGEVVPVLMQGRLQNADPAITFNMLVEGIEKLNFMFGIDTDADGVINAYMPSGNMLADYWYGANGVRILAVKMHVLVRAIRQDFNYENNNVYQLGDESFDANGDHYRRLLFSSTVSLHNSRVDRW